MAYCLVFLFAMLVILLITSFRNFQLFTYVGDSGIFLYAKFLNRQFALA